MYWVHLNHRLYCCFCSYSVLRTQTKEFQRDMAVRNEEKTQKAGNVTLHSRCLWQLVLCVGV